MVGLSRPRTPAEGLRRGKFRVRHPLYFGSLLTRPQVLRLVPIAFGGFGLFLIMAGIFATELASASRGRLIGAGGFAAFLLLSTVWFLCVLAGYAARQRLAVPPELAAKMWPEPEWPEIPPLHGRSLLQTLVGSKVRAAWIIAGIVWLIVGACVWGFVTGELVIGNVGKG